MRTQVGIIGAGPRRRARAGHGRPQAFKRIWRAGHFSWWMTAMLHRFRDDDPIHQRLRRSQLEYVVGSRAAAASLAGNHVGLPRD